MKLEKKDLMRWAASQRDEFESTLKELVETQSVSADPDRKDDIRAAAGFAANKIRELGGEASILETAGYPLVHGRFTLDKSAPTITVYNHLDVQPAS
jgi:acetylornithine deacetylase/succinyl-diaminopimelate desuccinylase-like protein